MSPRRTRLLLLLVIRAAVAFTVMWWSYGVLLTPPSVSMLLAALAVYALTALEGLLGLGVRARCGSDGQ